MINNIYIEEAVQHHPRVLAIKKKFPDKNYIKCQRYTEIFNRKAQNFRLQKKLPCLILASKYKNYVLPIPETYGIGARYNYYFSHMLNCIYDCRYCFLQGMFRSANYVLFVNYEDFSDQIKNISEKHANQTVHLFSGYDCDSLALEPVSGFTEYFLEFFESLPNTTLELRTKSTQIRSLLNRKVIPNCVIAFSMTPEEIAGEMEFKTPSIRKRIEAMQKLQEKGWLLGLRFDPLIYHEQFKTQYKNLFEFVFSRLRIENLHSVSLGSFRLPKEYFRKIQRLYPEEKLLYAPLSEKNGLVTYRPSLQNELISYCTDKVLEYIPEDIFFPCHETIAHP